MSLFNIPIAFWLVFFAALVSVAALITIAIGYRKKEIETSPLTLILVAIATGLLIISLFLGMRT